MTDVTGATPPPVPPDDKDWTWVLERACPECGLDTGSFPHDEVGAMLRANAAEWIALLRGDAAVLRRRPSPEVWSVLEYAAHVRDVFRIYDERLARMLDEDGPLYANWDQDATAVGDRYDTSDPAVVADEIDEAAARLADRFDSVSGDGWNRTGHRSDGASFTVDSFARYFIHDPIHHLYDVARQAR